MDLFNSPLFHDKVEALMKRHHVPGLSIAVVQNEKTASAGFGVASVDACHPCTADTVFDIASCTKSMTAAAVALLVDDDEHFPDVQYDACVAKLLPDDFVMSEVEYTNGVTVDDVLGHRTGMPG